MTRTCRYQAIVFALAYLKILLIGVIALPFLIWNDDSDFQEIFMLNLVLSVGYLVFGNVIDSTSMKKELTIILETFVGLLFCANGLLMYFGYSSNMGVQMGVMRVFALMSLFASEIELISLYQVVVWFSGSHLGPVMAMLNSAFLAVFIPSQLLIQEPIAYAGVGILVLFIALVDWKYFIVHPLFVRAAVDVD